MFPPMVYHHLIIMFPNSTVLLSFNRTPNENDPSLTSPCFGIPNRAVPNISSTLSSLPESFQWNRSVLFLMLLFFHHDKQLQKSDWCLTSMISKNNNDQDEPRVNHEPTTKQSALCLLISKTLTKKNGSNNSGVEITSSIGTTCILGLRSVAQVGHEGLVQKNISLDQTSWADRIYNGIWTWCSPPVSVDVAPHRSVRLWCRGALESLESQPRL